jgi:hypothetical protein
MVYTNNKGADIFERVVLLIIEGSEYYVEQPK